MSKVYPNKEYVIQYWQMGHLYRFPVDAGSKEGAILKGLGTKAYIKQMHITKIKVALRSTFWKKQHGREYVK